MAGSLRKFDLALNVLARSPDEESFDLRGRIRLLYEARPGHEPGSHLIGQWASGYVKHWQMGPEADCLISHVIAAKGQGSEPDVHEKRVDWLLCQ